MVPELHQELVVEGWALLDRFNLIKPLAQLDVRVFGCQGVVRDFERNTNGIVGSARLTLSLIHI